MSVTGTPTINDDLIVVTPTGDFTIDGLAGNDTLDVNFSSLSTSIYYRDAGYGWWSFGDDFFTNVKFLNFEQFILRGGSGDDYLYGRDNNDQLYGNAGDDTLRSGLGADIINGGTGSHDRWIADYGSLGSNVDIRLKASGSWTVAATGAVVSGIEQIDITTANGADNIDTLEVTGNDTVNTGDGNDVFKSAGGYDSFNGGLGNDRLVIDYSDSTTRLSYSDRGYGWWRLADLAGKQWVDYVGVETFDITGGSASDQLRGGDGNDRLVGNGGNDYLIGGKGVDQIFGGGGTDTWEANYGDLTTAANVNLVTQTTNTGATISGVEALHYTGSKAEDAVVASKGFFNDWIETGDANDSIATGRGRDHVNGGIGTDIMVMDWSGISDPAHGISHSDIGYGWWRYAAGSGDQLDYVGIERFDLTGGAGADLLVGRAEYDWLRGKGGNDQLNSASGDALIDGGTGNDRWLADLSAEDLSVRIKALASQTKSQGGTAGLDVRNIEKLTLTTGAAADILDTSGYAFNDTIVTNAGNDSINPGLGRDSVNGGDGNDKLIVDWSSLTDASDGIVNTDQGYGWWRFGTADGGTYVDYLGIERFDLKGSQAADYLAGGSAYDKLRGNNGNDTLNSRAGDALIHGGAGNDLWMADLSAETSRVLFDATASQTTSQATLAGLNVRAIEQLNLTTGVGADVISTADYALDDTIDSGAGNDTIAAGLGRDSINGGVGSDTLVLNYSTLDSAISRSDAGYGWLRYSDANDTTSTTYLNIERFDITGGSDSDYLIGADSNDKLIGGAGDDTLDGKAGNDSINGGSGNDTWIGNHGAATTNLTLNLDASGTGALVGVGTKLASIENIVLTTGSGNDTFNLGEGSGNATIVAGAGKDTIDVGMGRMESVNGGAGGDILYFDAGLAAGALRLSDIGYGWQRYSSLAGDYQIDFVNIESLVIDATNKGDRLIGLAGSDTLNGRGGADVIQGAGGNDTLTGGGGTDQFYFDNVWTNGVDTITDAAAGDFLRLANVNLVGSMGVGNGSTLIGGHAEIGVSSGITTIYVGVDNTAGYDFRVTLAGAFAATDFSLSGHDILII